MTRRLMPEPYGETAEEPLERDMMGTGDVDPVAAPARSGKGRRKFHRSVQR